jgi:AraC family transcriptional regulator
VGQLTSVRLLKTSLVEVMAVACCSRSAPAGAEEWNHLPQIVLPRRGVFTLHRDGATTLADATTVVVFGLDEHYRVSHPSDGGDESITLRVPPDVHEDGLHSLRGSSGRVSPRTQLGASVFVNALGRADMDVLAAEEAALILVDRLATDLGSRSERRLSPMQRQRADDVRALFAGALDRSWSLDAAGQAVHCSPFHLARQFRLATRETLSRYLLRLRLAAALRRIADGETDLARLAADLGFSHHSHFTARFHALFGCTPTRARSALRAPRIDELSTIMTAHPDTWP